MKRTLFCILATALLLASCSNPFDKAAASSTELGSLSLSASSSSAKSILPASMTPASYTASGASSTGLATAEKSSTDGSFSFANLPVGDWTFSVEGLDSSNTVILSGTKAVTISVGATSSATIPLSPVSGTGTLSLSLSWTSAAGVSAVSATLTPSSGTANTIVFTVDSTNKMATYSGSLAAGSYELVVTAKNSEGTVVASSPMESVLIYASQTSSATFTISDDQLIAGSAGLIANIPLEIAVALSGNSSSLSHGSTMTVTATPSASVDSYAWYLDGTEQSGESSSSFTFGSSLGLGSHRLMAAVKKNGIAFSNSCSFTVIPAVTVSTFAGTYGQYETTDGTGTAARFSDPRGVATDGTNLYLVDYANNNIRKIVISSGEVTTLAGSGTYGGTDGEGTVATFADLTDIACDGTNLYVSQYSTSTIRKIVISSGVVTTLAGSYGNSGSVDGVGSAARFNCPSGLATDGDYLYVVDTMNNTIRAVRLSTGLVTTLAGIAGTSGYADGVGTAATFHTPKCIATDGMNLFVGDVLNYRIRKIVIATREVTTFAGSGTQGWVDGTGTLAGFYELVSLSINGGYLYVGDSYIVRKLKIATGEVSTIAGSTSSTSHDDHVDKDGSGTEALFTTINGMTCLGVTIYSTDSTVVRKITQE